MKGAILWLKKALYWDHFTPNAIRSGAEPKPGAKLADAERAVELIFGIAAFSVLGLVAEILLPSPLGVVIKYGLPAGFALTFALVIDQRSLSCIGLPRSRWAWALVIPALLPNGAFRLYQCATEEIIYRGVVLNSTRRWWGNVAGVVVSTALFTAMHPTAGPRGWATCIIFSVAASLYTMQRREIYGAIALHTMTNLIYDYRIISLVTGN